MAGTLPASLPQQVTTRRKCFSFEKNGNENSWALQRKLGYRRVAEVAGRCMADGRQTIEHVTALLRSDWQDRED